MAEGFPPCYVISLKTATERRTRVQQAFDTLALNFRWLDALDLRRLDRFDDYGIEQAYHMREGRSLTGGEVGCYLSHYRTLEKVVQEQHELAIILEDDMGLSQSIFEIVRFAMANRAHFEFLKLQSLFTRRKGPFWSMANVGSNAVGIRPFGTFGAQGYIVTRDGARKALNALSCTHIRLPLDDELFVYGTAHLNTLEMRDSALIDAALPTTIPGRECPSSTQSDHSQSSSYAKSFYRLTKWYRASQALRYYGRLKMQALAA
ncbi:glycosyltransferase family 25 protein [Rhodobacteraceae bacterium RKSG542]|uniref:glycosyltransferase family 25 protein n=1 Tax=Pseudovibrio flavus TaxID=2529854 RepID=UPI0012BC2491|nr:glycosyltransferase family 25 protein [Pseudovibrio flavus]MTI17530.1 glycosyltransferase family 25 protein [Pseudovibrio flavus]